MLTRTQAEALARAALSATARAFPYKLDQLLTGEDDLASPRRLHPAFWGSYDWHSSVHMHWTLARLLRRYPGHALAAASRAQLAARLTPEAIAGELATLRGPNRQSFERPYGWGWLLKLAAELEAMAQQETEAATWRDALHPLAVEISERLAAFLPRADFPTRVGAHGNSAFALLLALDWSDVVAHRALRRAVIERANRWFGHDRRYPAHYEPGGEDFLSAGLVEAALMQRVVDGCSFAEWWEQFRPTEDGIAYWLQPVAVSDPSDPKIVHLHGVNLVRAWCWSSLRHELPAELHAAIDAAIAAHVEASLGAATTGDFVGTHWLASFALLALDSGQDAAAAVRI
ncbi:MAG TPA: DUF2891 domain-containing protein [Burkholderiaceae bacterium]|nr:DUF2891 domain-containing protein [Burkholderiaceae bacterium]